MIFKQLFDDSSCTYTYLIGDSSSGKALLIDPVIEQTQQYLSLLEQQHLRLVVAVDTHTHADHITALGVLRDRTGCQTMLGVQAVAECMSDSFSMNDTITIGSLQLTALHTPGHTDDSYCFLLESEKQPILFTGDTLLIRSTGRTDFQNGNAEQQYNSLFNLLLQYPDNTLVYPGHDYNGRTVSTIGQEKQLNPRLQVNGQKEYVEIMDQLELPEPKLMDVAVPANQACGKSLPL